MGHKELNQTNKQMKIRPDFHLEIHLIRSEYKMASLEFYLTNIAPCLQELLPSVNDNSLFMPIWQ